MMLLLWSSAFRLFRPETLKGCEVIVLSLSLREVACLNKDTWVYPYDE